MSCCCEFKGCNKETKILGVIFDLDGTLLDTERATRGVLNEFLAKYGKELDVEKEEKKRLGMTQKDSAAMIVKDYELPLTPDQFIEEITPLYRKRWAEAKALPGANHLIKHLKKNEVPIALASNSLRENIDAKISHHKGWKESFSVIIGSDQVKSGKPSPYLFEEAAKNMGVDAVNCLVIEDSLVGVEAAKAAKMKVVAIPSQREADCSLLADIVLRSLLEFQPELWDLPPFDDWVDNTLPIEPIHLSGLYVNGTLPETTEREGGIVKKGHEEGLKMAASLLQEFELPEGLLPLANVVEVGFVKGTGYMWIVQSKKVEHDFKMIKKLVSYDSEITGYILKKKIKKLKGVKAKELMLWPPVSEITVDDPPTGKIHFKSLAGITKTFPVEAFAAGQ